MFAFFQWIARIIQIIWKPFFAVFTGFLVWLWKIAKDFFTRDIKNLRWRRKVFDSPAFTAGLAIYIGSIVSLFISIVSVLLDIYNTLFSKIESVASVTSNNDSLGLFNNIANSIGLWDVLKDTFSLWSPVFISLISFVIAGIYYKSTKKVYEKAKEFIFYSDSRKK